MDSPTYFSFEAESLDDDQGSFVELVLPVQ